MLNDKIIYNIEGIEFTVIYSGRRTLGISIRPDSSVIVRVPYFTSFKTIKRIVLEKSAWILKHRNSYSKKYTNKLNRLYSSGETHLFRGNELILKVKKYDSPFIRFSDDSIEMGLSNNDDQKLIKKLLYKGYRNEALRIFPEIFNSVLQRFENQGFKPAGLVIRTMKRRWGSCSNKGIITLSTELIKLSDLYIEYVIIHELCHLKHHNHGPLYYKLLSELFPEWKIVRKEMRTFIQ